MRAGKPAAVVDIGSNSVRLVVYRRIERVPHVLFNEKIMCGLGRSLQQTGRLDPAGVELALTSLARFSHIIRDRDVGTVDAVATAAVRDAADGDAFLARLKQHYKLDARLLSGDDEARLSAIGVAAGIPGADGLVGDLGGGSLELVRLTDDNTKHVVSLPLGPFRLRRDHGADRAAARARVDTVLDQCTWLGEAKGKTLFAVGGAWRAIARLRMAQLDYPLRIIHQYRVGYHDMVALADLVAAQSPASLARIEGVPGNRIDALPLAALVLKQVLRRMRPDAVVFSAYGLREGLLLDRLPKAARRADPLLAECEEIARRFSRVPAVQQRIADWVAPLFADQPQAWQRLCRAACLISDIAYECHPDHRPEHAFLTILRWPGLCVDHQGRGFLAFAVMYRYTGKKELSVSAPIEPLLDPDLRASAATLGAAMRLALTISAGNPDILDRTRLSRDGDKLILSVPAADRDMFGHVAGKRLEMLAKQCGATGELVAGDAPIARAAS